MATSYPSLCGILNLDKPRGLTSHQAVEAVRRIGDERRAGHAGTLDPLATGVLLVCLGPATRVSEYLTRGKKVYRANVRLGVETDTYDAEGRVLAQAPVPDFSSLEIKGFLSSFIGCTPQVPPMHSALKHGGQPLYELARKGLVVERKPRTVEIYRLDLLDWTPPQLSVEVECSPGTYIRSLAHDLGRKLGCGGHLAELRRLACGPFTAEEATPLHELEARFVRDRWQTILIPMDQALPELPTLVLDEEAARMILRGQDIEGRASTPLCRAYSSDGRFIAILESRPESNLWHPRKVFATA